MRGEQAYGGAARSPLGERVGGDLLGDQCVEEGAHAEVVALLLGPRGDLEQRADGVQVAVGAAGGSPAQLDRAAQPLGPTGARPQPPQQLLGGLAGLEGRPGAGQQVRDRACTVDVGRLGAGRQPLQRRGVEHGLAEQVARGSRGALLGVGALLLACAEAAREPAYVTGVEATQRAGQQRLGACGTDVVGVGGILLVEVDHGAQGVEQRQHRGVAHQRELVAGHLDGHAGRTQRATQRRDGAAARAHQHRHLVPADAVLEVGAAQQVGEVLGLGTFGVEGPHHHAPLDRGLRARHEERLAG